MNLRRSASAAAALRRPAEMRSRAPQL